mmetsp:Transcript_49775/g.130919  ORF Transcript_49775/g.130919 Transcript_49775/m.130919 type:complete len:122 (+) Transcript_49775:288-653(+)
MMPRQQHLRWYNDIQLLYQYTKMVISQGEHTGGFKANCQKNRKLNTEDNKIGKHRKDIESERQQTTQISAVEVKLRFGSAETEKDVRLGCLVYLSAYILVQFITFSNESDFSNWPVVLGYP